MKRTASIITISTSALFLAAALPVFAVTNVDVSNNGEGSRTNVKVETNTGGNTICQNGKCTTTSNTNNGTSKVCVNGVCQTSENGDVDYKSDDGNTKVNIKTNSDSSTSVKTETEDKVVVKRGVPTITPTTFKDVKGAIDERVAQAKAEADKKKAELEKKAAEVKETGIAAFIASIQDFFEGIFGKK